VRRLEGIPDFTKVVSGNEAALKDGSFTDNGLSLAANFLEGQKTGSFLDQRANRRFLHEALRAQPAQNAADFFCHSGAWGLTALRAGVKETLFVDSSADALAAVKKGLALNNLPPTAGRCTTADVFNFLIHDERTFDLIVCDPPAFAKTKKDLPQAQHAYEKLNRLAWRRLKPGGLLITCSCSFHLDEADFLSIVRTAVAREKGHAHVVYRGGQADDHPVLLSMPETRYLKCLALRKIAF
jgi:23S rRNA (cytosine1962-C5)-methyltransferase